MDSDRTPVIACLDFTSLDSAGMPAILLWTFDRWCEFTARRVLRDSDAGSGADGASDWGDVDIAYDCPDEQDYDAALVF